GQHVEVLAGVQRHGNPGHAPDLAPPHAGAVDHLVGPDRPALGLDAGNAAVRPRDAGDLAALDDPGAVLAGALGQGLGDVDRVGLAVGRDADGAGEIADLDQGVQRARLDRGQLLDLEAAGATQRRLALQFRQPGFGARERDAAVLLEAGRLAGLRLEPEVELGGIFGE